MITEQQLLKASDDDYMNEDQLTYFENLLESLVTQTLTNIESARNKLKEPQQESDELDKALVEEDLRTRMRFLERQTKLLPKLREALKRIHEGEFGFCVISGEPIGIRRLLLRPTATLSTEEKTRQEQEEKQNRVH